MRHFIGWVFYLFIILLRNFRNRVSVDFNGLCVWQAYWNTVLEDTRRQPPDYERVLYVLKDIHEGICEVRKEESDLISEIIDIKFITQQVSVGAYTWENSKRLVLAVVDIVKRIQAPARVAAMQTKWGVLKQIMEVTPDSEGPVALVKALEFLSWCMRTLRIDEANARW